MKIVQVSVFFFFQIEEDREDKIKLKLMDERLALNNVVLSRALLNRNKMTEIEALDVLDNSDSVDSMKVKQMDYYIHYCLYYRFLKI